MTFEKQRIIAALEEGIRFDGRKPLDYRNIEISLGGVKTAEGFARVKIGETEVLAGIKLSIDKPFPDTPDEGGISVNAELPPMASPEFESGPPSDYAIELARIVDRGIRESKTIDLKKLCIEPYEKAWFVNIDLWALNDSGNLLDAFGIAAIAALKNTFFPEYDGKVINYKKITKKKLEVKKTPIPVTVIKIGKHLIVDPTVEEESALDARLTVTTTEDETITALQKGGSAPLTIREAKEMISIALKKAKELRKIIEKEMK
jgi:exosome complex component RRP42